MRGLAATVAGLIIIAFLLVSVLPLVVRVFTQSAEVSFRVSGQVARRVARSPGLSVYEEPVGGGAASRTYYVENNAPGPEELYMVVVSSPNGTFLARVVDALGAWLAAGDTRVMVSPVEGAAVAGEVVEVKPLGKVRIEVVNGRLLGVITVDGFYVGVEYSSSDAAEVAQSVRLQYMNLSRFTSLEDLFNSSDIIVATDLSSTTSEQSLLYSGFIESYCYRGNSNPVRGGFTVEYRHDLEALYVNNLGPDPGMLIVGGRQAGYASKNVTVSIYMPAYTLAPVREGEPGILVVRTTGWDVLCVSMPTRCLPAVCHSFRNSLVAQFFEQHMLRCSLSEHAGTPPSTITVELTDGLYAPGLGLVAYTSSDVLYCPPESLSGIHYDAPSHSETMFFTECILFRLAAHSRLDEYSLSSVAVTLQGVHIDTDTGVHGFSSAEAAGQVSSHTYYKASGRLVFPAYPVVLKVESTVAVADTLMVYDYGRGRYYNGTGAFGVYYYSGYRVEDIGIKMLYSLDVFSRGGIISVYVFEPGATSGLAPFTIIADTDGNGLAELIFTDEWFKPGPSYISWGLEVYDLSDVITDISPGEFFNPVVGGLRLRWYGCVERTLARLYLKLGPRYAVNGSETASVSIQVRYSYHDSVGADIDEIDDPKNGIWGFYVVDENGSIVTNTEYIYQQLSVLEDTLPPNSNYVSEAAFLPVPDSPELYYIAWGVSEDYTMDYIDAWPSAVGYINDLEQTVMVEWVGVWYLHR